MDPTEDKQTLLSVKELTVEFSGDEGVVRAVDRISFDLFAGEIVGLVGESGCGKSATAMSILRLLPEPSAKIQAAAMQYGTADLSQLSVPELRRVRGAEIGVIFQEPMTALSPLHRVGAQLVETLQLHHPIAKRDAWAKATEWLDKVGIPDPAERMYAYPFQLSGGMRQRVMIAMVMMLNPKLIIADEPTTALDVTIQAQIFALIRKMKNDNTTILLITHDMGVVWQMCDRLMVMYASRIVERGDVKAVFAQPRHPYTRGLLDAIPKFSESQDRLPTIPGQVPSPANYGKGCLFAPRCPLADDRCANEQPKLRTVPPNGSVACHHSH